MNRIELESKIEARQKMLGKRLEVLRLGRLGTSESVFKVSMGLGFGESTLYKIERGDSLPSFRTLKDLSNAYSLTIEEVKELEATVRDIRDLNTQLRKLNKKEGY
jgi:transcriptional regulator with XRE-family HTH domain